MNTKYLISTSVVTLFTASMTQAADIRIPRESKPVVAPVEANSVVSPVIAAPIFLWDGFYLGGQMVVFRVKVIEVYMLNKDLVQNGHQLGKMHYLNFLVLWEVFMREPMLVWGIVLF